MCVAKLTEFMPYYYAAFKHLRFQNTLERKTCFLFQSEKGAHVFLFKEFSWHVIRLTWFLGLSMLLWIDLCIISVISF